MNKYMNRDEFFLTEKMPRIIVGGIRRPENHHFINIIERTELYKTHW